MTIDYPAVLGLEEKGPRYAYTERDAMLYALAVGLGSNSLNEQELPFIYEKNLRAVPTLATVIAWGAGVSTDRLGVNQKLVLHGEEETIFHRTLAPSGAVLPESRVVEVYDKGKDKGAVILRRTVLRDEADGAPVATINRTIIARGDGGAGGSAGAPRAPHVVPERRPDATLSYETRPDQAALYRLCGDRNPLHVDPRMAQVAGFTAPILHGLCTYGMTCRAVLETYCDFDPSFIASHAVRFSSPVYPGETLKVDLWRDEDTVSFEASVPQRGVTVVKSGKSMLRPDRWLGH